VHVFYTWFKEKEDERSRWGRWIDSSLYETMLLVCMSLWADETSQWWRRLERWSWSWACIIIVPASSEEPQAVEWLELDKI
jgi:hypothetical protein